MMTLGEQKLAAKAFIKRWEGKGYEKGDTSRFWIDLLQTVYGIANATHYIEFEDDVKIITKEKGTDYIDGYIPDVKVLIEQKGLHVNLSSKIRQSDGSLLTPYQQARRYAAGLPQSKMPRWIVVCNFGSFEIHDMERPNDEPEVIELKDLDREFHRMGFLVDNTENHIRRELEVSIQAGAIIGEIYDKLLARYLDPSSEESQKALNKLCVRLVFCLYAEDAGIFGKKNMFHNYMQQFQAKDFRKALIGLFEVLDTRPEDRDPYLEEDLSAFPYVNGGMFTGSIEIPRIDDEIRELILRRASDDFDWSQISPTIFGAVFESTLNPETRRSGGMHYTSIENIHKVIDPLFLDGLKEEFSQIKSIPVTKTRKERAMAFQEKLARLKFFDPACGSGNFLTQTYISLRRLENEALRIIYGGDRLIGELVDPVKVSINQFYGIEINDFACSVAQTALWIAEAQMIEETDEIVGFNIDPLPLKTYTNIHEGNALRMDWNTVVPAGELDYIMGNPPFVGNNQLNKSQREDLLPFFPKNKTMDYVCCWYKKAAEFIKGTKIKCAFVSTNSICQGEQVSLLWKDLINVYNLHIDFAYQTFKWNSEASQKAAVHCVIVGFSSYNSLVDKVIFLSNGQRITCQNISPYLIDAPTVFVESRSKPLCNVKEIRKGNQPTEGGNLIIEASDYEDFIKKEPGAKKYLKRLMGAKEFINGDLRWCLWLVNVSPAELRKLPLVLNRVQKVKEMRESSPDIGTRKLALTPTTFRETNNPISAIIIPSHSSENRNYIPMGFIDDSVIVTNAVLFIPDAEIYHFGILTSSVHMAWTRVVCGRIKSDYRYSKDIVYNNFPWPEPTAQQKERIEKTAQAILDARAGFPDSSLADLYDPLTMPPALLKAHRENDAAVLSAYGLTPATPEPDIVAHLFRLWRTLTAIP